MSSSRKWPHAYSAARLPASAEALPTAKPSTSSCNPARSAWRPIGSLFIHVSAKATTQNVLVLPVLRTARMVSTENTFAWLTHRCSRSPALLVTLGTEMSCTTAEKGRDSWRAAETCAEWEPSVRDDTGERHVLTAFVLDELGAMLGASGSAFAAARTANLLDTQD